MASSRPQVLFGIAMGSSSENLQPRGAMVTGVTSHLPLVTTNPSRAWGFQGMETGRGSSAESPFSCPVLSSQSRGRQSSSCSTRPQVWQESRALPEVADCHSSSGQGQLTALTRPKSHSSTPGCQSHSFFHLLTTVAWKLDPNPESPDSHYPLLPPHSAKLWDLCATGHWRCKHSKRG